MIKQETVNKIYESARIEEIVGDFVDLKKRGTSMIGLCPFHNEKTPSFHVSVSKGIYKCFGCGEGGHAIDFIMKHEKYTYPEALRYIAKKYNIEVEEEAQSEEELLAKDQRESLFIITNWAGNYFQDNLWNTQEGKSIGYAYFKERGFTDETIRKFHLGYAQEAWQALYNEAKKLGYQEDYLLETGLIIKKDEAKVYDRFRARVVYPIHNLSGRVLGFGARTLKKDERGPKYINSPETSIYHKADVLYGLHLAKKAIVEQDNCYMVEGYMDVIAMHQAGVENVVASSGTSLTLGQIRLIRRFTKHITLLYDADPAGIKAAMRGADILLQEDLDIKILTLNQGEDPDSFIKKHGASKFKTYITEEAKDFISFKTEQLLKAAGDDPIRRASLIKEVVQSIARIPDQIKASIFLKQCSVLLEIEEQALISEYNKILIADSKRTKPVIPPEEPRPEVFTPDSPSLDAEASLHLSRELQEKEIIRLLLHYGHLPAYWEKDGKMPIAVFMFIALKDVRLIHPVCKKIIQFYQQKLQQQQLPEQRDFTYHSDKEVAELAVTLLSEKHHLSPNWNDDKRQIYVSEEKDHLKETINKAIYRMKKREVEALIHKIRIALKEEKSEDNMLILMDKYHKLKKIEKEILSFLGTVITR